MAFHPFRSFRKHQKVIWGVLVIVCMVTFVLMSGSGRSSIFDGVTQWARRGRAQKVTTLYGQSVDVRQFDELRQQRLLAQRAFESAQGVAFSKVNRELSDLMQAEKKKTDAKAPPTLEEFEKRAKLQKEGQEIDRLGMQLRIQFPQNARPENLLDFLVWRRQADKLGIQFTSQDIDGELKNWSLGRTDMDEVLGAMNGGRTQAVTREQVQKAVGEEFRVLSAQLALLNYEPGMEMFDSQFAQFFGPPPANLKQVPGAVTPFEFWKYYKEQRTALHVALLPVPVTPSASQSPDELGKKEMQALYRRYKDVESRPDQATPGFKEPRRIKLAWVAARPEDAYYQKTTADLVPALTATLGNELATSALQTGVPFVADWRFLSQYNDLKLFGRLDLAPLTQPDFPLSIYSTRMRPEDAATFVAGSLASATTQDSPLTSLLALQAGVAQHNAKDMEPLVQAESKKRIRYGMTLLGSSIAPGLASLTPALNTTVWSVYGERARQSIHGADPVFVPLPEDEAREAKVRMAAIQGEVTGLERAGLARDLVFGNLKAFQTAMDKQRARGATPDERTKSVQEWLKTALKEYHLEQPQAMDTARDQYDIGNDPVLKPLKETFLRDRFPSSPKAEREFGSQFFQDEGKYKPAVWPPNATLSPQHSWEREKDVYLVWRTAEDPATVLPYEKVKDKVEAAWRLTKARTAAREEAEKLDAEVRQTKGELATVKQFAAEHKLETPIDLKEVAREVPEKMAVPGGRRYTAYQFPDSVTYPGTDWVNKMLDNLKEPGDAVVLANQPETTYYVAVLVKLDKDTPARIEPSIRDFHDVYRDVAIDRNRDEMLNNLARERRAKYREEFIKQLRIAAGADENGQYKLDPEYLKSHSGRSGSEGEE